MQAASRRVELAVQASRSVPCSTPIPGCRRDPPWHHSPASAPSVARRWKTPANATARFAVPSAAPSSARPATTTMRTMASARNGACRALPPQARAGRGDFHDEDDAEPVRREKSSSMALPILVGVGLGLVGLVVVCGGIGAFWYLGSSEVAADAPVAMAVEQQAKAPLAAQPINPGQPPPPAEAPRAAPPPPVIAAPPPEPEQPIGPVQEPIKPAQAAPGQPAAGALPLDELKAASVYIKAMTAHHGGRPAAALSCGPRGHGLRRHQSPRGHPAAGQQHGVPVRPPVRPARPALSATGIRLWRRRGCCRADHRLPQRHGRRAVGPGRLWSPTTRTPTWPSSR